MEVSPLNSCEFMFFPSGKRTQKKHKSSKNLQTRTNGKNIPMTTPTDTHLLVSRLNTNSFIRRNNLRLRPNAACFVDYDTKVRLGLGATLDFSEPRVKRQLEKMETGETITIGSDNRFFEYCDEDTSPAHIQLTKMGSSSFILKDLNSEWGTTVLKNVDTSTQLYQPVSMVKGIKYPTDMRASIKLSGFEEISVGDLKGITKLQEADKTTIRACDLTRSDDGLTTLFDDIEPILSVEKRNDRYYLSLSCDKGFAICYPRGNVNYKPAFETLPKESSIVDTNTVLEGDSKSTGTIDKSEQGDKENPKPVTRELSKIIVKDGVEYTCTITYQDGLMHSAKYKARVLQRQLLPNKALMGISKTLSGESIKRIPGFILQAFPQKLTDEATPELALG